ncbi:MAG: sel1 repeat family protein, partial [Clostridia bacterium]|nr:sel1 repeat family protein [Clostridia bacterium]
MKSFSRVLLLFSIIFAAFFSECSDSTSDSGCDIKKLQKAAEQGDAEAQNDLGHCYVIGDGVEKDEKEAVKWFRKAAEQGVAGAQFNLAQCYERG